MNVELPLIPDPETDALIIAETRKYNQQYVPDDYAPISVYCRDGNGSVVGGLTGKTYWSYLDIEFLWVEEQYRKQGLASKILGTAEQEAKRRDCKFSMLDTYEFQALEFYLKQGYEQFGRLDGYCDRFKRYFLRKKL